MADDAFFSYRLSLIIITPSSETISKSSADSRNKQLSAGHLSLIYCTLRFSRLSAFPPTAEKVVIANSISVIPSSLAY